MEHTTHRKAHRLLILLGIATVTLAVVSYALVPLRASQDEWWHLKTGQWIWNHGALPKNDIFTYTGENQRWYNHEWLSQLLFYASYAWGDRGDLGGVRALVLFKTVVVAGTFILLAWLMRLRGAAWPAVLLMTFLAAEISRRTIYPRPPIFSYLLLVIFLLILYQWKSGRLRNAWLWLLPALTVLWGNLHGMVLLAIVLVGAFAAGETIENVSVTWRESDKRTRKSVRELFRATFTRRAVILWLLFGVTIVAAMAQPSGYHIFFLGRNFTADPLLQQEILEMKPPPFFFQKTRLGDWRFVPGFASFWFAVSAIVPLLLLNRLRLPTGADYLLLGFFTYQGVMHWRLLPLFALAAAPAVAALLAEVANRLSLAARRLYATSALALSIVMPLIFVFFVDENGTFFRRNMDLVRGEVMSHDDYPTPLLDFIIDANLPGHMFSESNYCGYFMWRLSPERHKLFTDNRFDLFGSRFRKLEKIILAAGNKGDSFGRNGEPFERGWNELLTDYGVNFVVIHRDPRPGLGPQLQEALIRSGKWKDVYYYMPPEALAATGGRLDPKAGYSVWVRDEPKFSDVHSRCLERFRRDCPNYPLPDVLDKMLLSDPAVAAVSPYRDRAPATTNWRVPTGS